jgi:hypothetical protein
MESKQDILKDAWDSWRIHPITHELVKILEAHKESFVVKLASIAGTADEQMLRSMASGIRDTDTVIKLISNYDIFRAQVTK